MNISRDELNRIVYEVFFKGALSYEKWSGRPDTLWSNVNEDYKEYEKLFMDSYPKDDDINFYYVQTGNEFGLNDDKEVFTPNELELATDRFKFKSKEDFHCRLVAVRHDAIEDIIKSKTNE